MVLALNEYGGTAQYTYKLLCPVLGQSGEDEWAHLVNWLINAIRDKAPFALVGSGVRFGPAADEY